MKKLVLFFPLVILSVMIIHSCGSTPKGLLSTVNSVINNNNSGGTQTPGLTNDEIVSGLKEALRVGANNAGATSSKLDGFYKNTELFIPFPEEAIKVKNKLKDVGFENKINEFEMSLNRAAEKACEQAAPIFVNAVTNMSIQDALGILKGGDTAATSFLRKTTSNPLKEKFKPVVKDAIDKVQVTKYWEPLITKYNQLTLLTGGEKINPDLNEYVTQRALSGLFKLVASEEKKIRKDPVARVTDILKKVFGSKEAEGK
ncbi:MAG: DUF4197 domain-containing protein [Bacteroidota bacterium]|jgi:hypothetical protein